MDHIKTFNELLKSTYLSASNKLRSNHSKRASDLIDHALKHGKDVTSHDRIYPHRFLYDRTHEGEYFFITGYSKEEVREKNTRFLIFKPNLISNWGNKKEFRLIFQVYRLQDYRIDDPYLELDYRSEKFENDDSMTARKNANHMIRFFKECWEDDISEEYPDFIIKQLSVNKLYKSI